MIKHLVNNDTVVVIKRNDEASIQEHRHDTKKNGRWGLGPTYITLTQCPSVIHPVTQITCYIVVLKVLKLLQRQNT